MRYGGVQSQAVTLTGEIGASDKPSISNTNVKVPATMMCVFFFLGLCSTTIAGWQCVGIANEIKHEGLPR